jgi:hypothetical protein
MEWPSIPKFPDCHRCKSAVRLITTMKPLEDGSEIYLVECTKCLLADMYMLTKRVLRRV